MIPWTQKRSARSPVPRPATGETKIRKFRLDDQMYEELERVADEQGRTMTAVVKDALLRYFAWHRRQQRKQKSDGS